MRSPRANLHKRYSLIAGSLLLVYLFFSSGFKTLVKEGIIERTEVEDVFLFLSDFSKLKTLNPTILDFAITADQGNREHWKYSVDYTERLSHWPHLLNYNQGHISAKTTGSEIYLIESQTTTCFLGGFYCLTAEGVFELEPTTAADNDQKISKAGTRYRETVRYQCPPFMGFFCRREVSFQRETIFQNLRQHFHNQRLG